MFSESQQQNMTIAEKIQYGVQFTDYDKDVILQALAVYDQAKRYGLDLQSIVADHNSLEQQIEDIAKDSRESMKNDIKEKIETLKDATTEPYWQDQQDDSITTENLVKSFEKAMTDLAEWLSDL